MREVLIFGFESNDLSKRLEESVGVANDEVKIELFDDICFFFQDLGIRIKRGAAIDEILQGRHLVGLLELSSDKDGSYANQLQLAESNLFYSQIFVNQRHCCKQRLGKHFVFVVQFGKPIHQFRPLLLGYGPVIRQIVQWFVMLQFLHFEVFDALLEVLGHELQVGGWQGQDGGLVSGSKGAIGFGDWVGSELVLLFLSLFGMQVGIALFVSGFGFDQVGYLFAEHSEIHVAVKINYYNVPNIMTDQCL